MADIRLDRGTLGAQLRPRLFEGVVARTHAPDDPLAYSTGPEYRDLPELARIVEQLPGLPVVTYEPPDHDNPLGHPASLLATGAEYHEIGRVISGRVDGDLAVATIYIHDEGALREITDGTKALSLGYRCRLDENKYQRGIKLDHLSVVWRARCGETCSLRTDAAEGSTCGCVASSVPTAKVTSMKVADLTAGLKIVLDDESREILNTLGGVTVSATTLSTGVGSNSDEHADCTCKNRANVVNNEGIDMDPAEIQKKLDEALAKVAELEGEVTSLKSDAEKTELELNQAKLDLNKAAKDADAIKADALAKIEAAAAKAADAEKARSDADDEEFAKRVDARVELLSDAEKVGLEDAKSLSDRAIKVAIVKKVDEMDIEDDRSADFVNGMYAGAMKRHTKAAESVAEVRTVIEENKDSVVTQKSPEAEAKAEAEERRKNRWRTK